jgi:hypothetical protein
MELYLIIVSIIVASMNFFMKVSGETQLAHKVCFVLCLYIIISPIISQLKSRRHKKTFGVWIAMLFSIAGFIGIAASLFVSIEQIYTMICWGLLLGALALQNCSIFYHSSKYSIRINPDMYKVGLYVLLAGLLTEFAVIYPLKIDLYLYSSIGIAAHAISVIGCLIMRASAGSLPKSNIT